MKSAYFAGGCFWCITPIFVNTKGVLKVTSGYAGGNTINPTYEQVKSQSTGHRETIKIDYDESIISYNKLVDIFTSNVDLFDPDGQYIDKGFSYTLAIFYNSDDEKEISGIIIKELEVKYDKKICISLLPFINFYEAEEYHQDYYKKNPDEFKKELKESGRLK